MSLLREQIIRIQLWRPEASFEVQLQKPAKERLQKYHGILSRNGGDKHSAKRQMIVTPKIGSDGKLKDLTDVEAVEMDHAEHIDTQLTGTAKGIEYLLDTVLSWIETEVEGGRMTRMPPIEFLIDEAKPGDTITNPENNYDRWTAQQDGIEYKSPSIKIKSASKGKSTTTQASSCRPAIDRRPPPKIKLILKKVKHDAPTEATSSTTGITEPKTRQSPPSPLANKGKGKGKQRASLADDLPRYVPPAPLTTTKRKRSPADDLPLYVPPTPLPPRRRSTTTSPPALKKQRPPPIDTALANAKLPACTDHTSSSDSSLTSFESEHEQPDSANTEQPESAGTELPASAYTEVESSPIRVRNMIFAGSKRKRVLREAEPASSTDTGLTTLESERPESAYTEVESSPIRARGMIFAGPKRRRVLREQAEDEA